MKLTQPRESAATKTKRTGLRGQQVPASGASAREVVVEARHAADRVVTADAAERAVAALEQRRDAPITSGSNPTQSVREKTTETEPVNLGVPVDKTTDQLATEPVTQAQIAAAIAEGAATPFEELVAGEGMQADSPELEAEQAGKAEPVAETPELDVGPVKRRG